MAQGPDPEHLLLKIHRLNCLIFYRLCAPPSARRPAPGTLLPSTQEDPSNRVRRRHGPSQQRWLTRDSSPYPKPRSVQPPLPGSAPRTRRETPSAERDLAGRPPAQSAEGAVEGSGLASPSASKPGRGAGGGHGTLGTQRLQRALARGQASLRPAELPATTSQIPTNTGGVGSRFQT